MRLCQIFFRRTFKYLAFRHDFTTFDFNLTHNDKIGFLKLILAILASICHAIFILHLFSRRNSSEFYVSNTLATRKLSDESIFTWLSLLSYRNQTESSSTWSLVCARNRVKATRCIRPLSTYLPFDESRTLQEASANALARAIFTTFLSTA